MAEITYERRGQLIRGAFKILYAETDGLPAKEVLRRMESEVPPTEFENSRYPKNPDIRRYEKIIRFSSIPAVKAGWLVKDRGQWSLTEEGRRAYDSITDPERFDREAVRIYREWAQDRPPPEAEAESAEDEPSSTTLEEAEESAWSDIEDHLKEIPPYDFQELVAGLLRGMKYHVLWVAPPGPDRGLDIIASSDPLGVSGTRIKVQVKRRQDRISVEEIRSFLAVLSDADVGIFVSNGGFTREAESEARNQERRRLILIDSRRLFDLWIEHYSQISDETRRLLPVKPVYFLNLAEGLPA